jgi:cell division protein FtsW (lipid II flippase)
MCVFALEFIWNILMILGFPPIIRVTLSFIGYGGSRALVQMAAIGLIMSIYRTKSLSYA